MTLGKLRGQRGAGGIGCLLILALVAGGVYGGFQYAMPTLRNNSFSDRLNESLWNFKRQSAEDIQKQVILLGTEFDIELKPEQVKVTTTNAMMSIDVTYEKTVDLKFWRKTLPFHLHRDVNL